ncbi:hexitol phosphatase HxpB [Segetibacter sp. 3557_3]|uniref:hexitol phosphatase HxpB n=1 Tax=Segetibacter sp. 3557_3 TaxID=2547429 RepID=UPI00105867E6|nr:hexitol phosphatase HxpB [Segetibacter sp. 3557_3]TDH27987.1 hexitol phosphatase HxpB [Segetibacter sp. 3557_3]
MELNTVIFDMDGLLIDSEPLWNEAADEVFARYGKRLTPEEYASSTGLRTSEFVAWWMKDYQFTQTQLDEVATEIIRNVIEKVRTKGKAMPGVGHIIDFFHRREFKIGLATSSPQALVDVVLDILQIRPYIQAIATAEFLEYGKPHPQVYLNCARQLDVSPLGCLCFEDSFNGMIAVKAARMKCVIVPVPAHSKDPRWSAADLKLSSLQNFGDLHIKLL